MSNLKQTVDSNPLLLLEAIIDNNITEIVKNIQAFTGVIVQPFHDNVFNELVNISQRDPSGQDLLKVLNVPIIEDNLTPEGIDFVVNTQLQYKSSSDDEEEEEEGGNKWGNIVALGLSGLMIALTLAGNGNNQNNNNNYTPPPAPEISTKSMIVIAVVILLVMIGLYLAMRS